MFQRDQDILQPEWIATKTAGALVILWCPQNYIIENWFHGAGNSAVSVDEHLELNGPWAP